MTNFLSMLVIFLANILALHSKFDYFLFLTLVHFSFDFFNFCLNIFVFFILSGFSEEHSIVIIVRDSRVPRVLSHFRLNPTKQIIRAILSLAHIAFLISVKGLFHHRVVPLIPFKKANGRVRGVIGMQGGILPPYGTHLFLLLFEELLLFPFLFSF